MTEEGTPQNQLVRLAHDETRLTLPNALDALWQSLEKTAAANITNAAGDQLEQYTMIEQRSMLLTEMLNQSKGLDLASVLVKGRIIDEIERDALFAAHPAGYPTLEQLAVDQGVGISELSNIRDMTRHIFPWLQERLGLDIYEVWEQVGKSNMRELVPVLKRIITGEEGRATLEATYQRVMDDVAATALAAGQELDEDGVQEAAVRFLLDAGELTNAEVRQRLRPERTPSIDAHLFTSNGTTYVVMALDDAQETMVTRRLHGYWDPIRLNLATHTREEILGILRQYPGLEGWVRVLIPDLTDEIA